VLPKARILIVEDETPVRELCARILSPHYEVVTAPEGATAVRLAQAHTPDLLLVDLQMPGIDGLETARRITAQAPEVVVLVMTGHSQAENLLATVRFGVNGFLLKPFQPADLRKTVEQCLHKGLYFKQSARLRSLTPLLDLHNSHRADADQARLFQVIAETVLHELHADYVSLVSPDEDDRDLVVARATASGVESDSARRSGYWRIKAAELASLIPNETIPNSPDADQTLSMALQAGDTVLGVVSAAKTSKPFTSGDREVLQLLATQGAIAIENARLLKRLRRSYWNTVYALAATVDLRDHPTRGHSDRLAQFALSMAKRVGLPDERLENLKIAALLHDIGKIGIRDGILRKPGDLTPEEYDAMKVHTLMGAKLLAMADFPPPVVEAVLLHHEWFDGSGYPMGLHGEQIPIEGRILAAADAFEGMTSERPYRGAMPVGWAIDELVRGRGTQFDPDVIASLVACVRDGEIRPGRVWDDGRFADEPVAMAEDEPRSAVGGP
jgi:putative nucleotidyltransferase with HDIG domain